MAIDDFNRALKLNPKHKNAELYLLTTKRKVEAQKIRSEEKRNESVSMKKAKSETAQGLEQDKIRRLLESEKKKKKGRARNTRKRNENDPRRRHRRLNVNHIVYGNEECLLLTLYNHELIVVGRRVESFRCLSMPLHIGDCRPMTIYPMFITTGPVQCSHICEHESVMCMFSFWNE